MDRKTKIVIVSCVFNPEPLVSARISEAIAENLSQNHEVVVLCPPPTRPVGKQWTRTENKSAKYQVVTLSSYTCPESRIGGRLRESYSFGKAVADYIRQHHKSIKAIYANTHPTFGQYLLLKAAKKYRIPCVIHIQDIYPESITSKLGTPGKIINPALVKIDAHYMRMADRLIAISTDMQRHLESTRNLGATTVEVVYNWQDEKRFLNASSENSKDKFTFMFLGNINPTANIPTVIHAFGQLQSKDVRLVIAGSGADKEHCREIASQYPEADIVFTEVMPAEVPATQASADVLLLPLLKGISKTALPSKLPAYMFSAKPVLACVESDSDVGRIISRSNCGWVCEPENIGELSAQMAKCAAADRKVLEAMGANGKEFGLNNFSTAVNLSKICSIISNIDHGSKKGDN